MRPINDLSCPKNNLETPLVNSFVNREDFTTTWDDFKVVANFFMVNRGPFELAIFDWEKAYCQIPTNKDQWPFLMIQDFEGGLYLDTRITFGGVAGCGSFGIPADVWKRIMAHELEVVHIFCWVDNNMFVKRPNSACKISEVVERLSRLGVATNEAKCSDFADEQKLIGFIWNGRESTVRLPEKKLEERINQIKIFLIPSLKFNFNDTEVIADRLTHVSFLLPQVKAYICGIYRWMNEWKKSWAKQTTPQDVVDNLSFWLATLSTFEKTRLIQTRTPTEVEWVGDASTSFGIGILIGHRRFQFHLKETWREG
jgi:hypothetical protein